MKKISGKKRLKKKRLNSFKVSDLVLWRSKGLRLGLGLALLLLIVGAAVKVTFLGSRVTEVSLGDNGFEPASVKINLGDKVVWRVEGSNPHWPAADIHPSHNSYPDAGGCLGSKLDACRAMKSGETFGFRFGKPGRWSMHDHLYPEKGMTVEVKQGGLVARFRALMAKVSWSKNEIEREDKFSMGQKKTLAEFVPGIDPVVAADKAKQVCRQWQFGKFSDVKSCYTEVFYELTRRTDAELAFKAIAELQKVDRTIGSCHTIAHGIGWAVYDEDPNNWKENMANMAVACSNAGIHAIIERYILTGGTFTNDTIPTICGPSPKRACTHGLGHVFLVQNKNKLDEALGLCGAFPGYPQKQRHDCLAGVFMERMIASNLYDHGYVSKERQQEWRKYLEEDERLCREQKGENIAPCWDMLVHPLTEKFKNEPLKILHACQTAQSVEAIEVCSRKTAQILTIARKFDFEAIKGICEVKIVQYPGFRHICYGSIVRAGVVNTTAQELKRAIRFCAGLAIDYREGCFKAVNGSLYGSYATESEVSVACAQMPPEYKSGCRFRRQAQIQV